MNEATKNYKRKKLTVWLNHLNQQQQVLNLAATNKVVILLFFTSTCIFFILLVTPPRNTYNVKGMKLRQN